MSEGEGWGTYREGRDGGGEVLGDGGRAARAGSGSGRGGPGGLGALSSRAMTVRSRAAREAAVVRLGGLGRRL